jgi:putative membrane protein
LIEHYNDFAANERTYLAWVRTALAFMAFGLLVERFDLFVRSLPMLEESPLVADAGFARAVGLVLILLGVLVMAVSSYRYLHFKRLIASGEQRDFHSSRTDLVFVVIVAAIGLLMTAYVASHLVS